MAAVSAGTTARFGRRGWLSATRWLTPRSRPREVTRRPGRRPAPQGPQLAGERGGHRL